MTSLVHVGFNLLNTSSWSFDLSQFDSVWKIPLQIVLVLAFLILGNMLRRLMPFLRNAFIPSALIGGLLLLGAKVLFANVFDFVLIDERLMQILTYHALAVGFIAMSFKIVKKEKEDNGIGIKATQNGLITGGTYMLQAVVGVICSLVFFFLGLEKFYDAGIILPLGFGQGPGNALTWDINFSAMPETGFEGNGSFGLTIASIGFIVASVVGVIYINYYKVKGQIKGKKADIQRKVEEFEGDNEIQDSDSVDKTSIQIAFVALAYGLSFLIMFLLAKISEWTGIALFNSVAWGFNFIFGVITATLIKAIVKFLRKKNLMKRNYINNYQMDRISGFAFDLMIVAGVASIDITIVAKYIYLIIALCAVGTVSTIIYVKLMTKYCFPEIRHESFLVNFGTLTGTASNGMILLREIDPAYETPTSNIFIVSQFPAMLCVAPLLLLLNMGAKSLTSCLITLGIYFVCLVAYTVINILITRKRMKKEKTE